MPGQFDCVIPAAGESKRMGSWKLLLPFRGRTVVEWSVRHALDACARVIVVTGFRGAELEALFHSWENVELVENPVWERGMFSSIKAGVSRVASERFFVALADMPLIRSELYRELSEHKGCDAVRPTYEGQKGHPVLLARSLVQKILSLDDSRSMADVLRGAQLIELPVDDRFVVCDLDTPSDYETLARVP